jgi:hypothetical protein
MPKTPKKSVKSKAKKPATKSKSKPKLKSSVTSISGNKGSRRGFMWKMLEQKQQKQKEVATSVSINVNPEERLRPNASHQGHARFNGPRRRAS